MTRRKVKFEIQIQGFSVKFEGDEEQAQQAVMQVGQGLAGLAGMPAQMLHLQKANGYSDNPTTPQIGAPSDVDAIPDSATKKNTKPSRSRGPKGESPQGLIEGLVDDGFFSQVRSADDVRNELSKKGFKYDGSALSTPLTRLTRKNVLVRDKSEDDKAFLYKKVSL